MSSTVALAYLLTACGDGSGKTAETGEVASDTAALDSQTDSLPDSTSPETGSPDSTPSETGATDTVDSSAVDTSDTAISDDTDAVEDSDTASHTGDTHETGDTDSHACTDSFEIASAEDLTTALREFSAYCTGSTLTLTLTADITLSEAVSFTGYDVVIDGGGYTLASDGADMSSLLTFSGADNALSIENLTLVAAGNSAALYVEAASSVSLENIRFEGTATTALQVDTSSSVAVSGATLTQINATCGFAITATDVDIAGLRIDGEDAAAPNAEFSASAIVIDADTASLSSLYFVDVAVDDNAVLFTGTDLTIANYTVANLSGASTLFKATAGSAITAYNGIHDFDESVGSPDKWTSGNVSLRYGSFAGDVGSALPDGDGNSEDSISYSSASGFAYELDTDAIEEGDNLTTVYDATATYRGAHDGLGATALRTQEDL